jgi:hypothetical protein
MLVRASAAKLAWLSSDAWTACRSDPLGRHAASLALKPSVPTARNQHLAGFGQERTKGDGMCYLLQRPAYIYISEMQV